jgi:transcriptional regulator with XRE-family HTH domain
MTNPTTLGTTIRQRRGQLHQTQEQLATQAGISNSTLRQIETGHRTQPTAKTIHNLEQALGWTPGSIQRITTGQQPTLTNTTERAPNPPPPTLNDHTWHLLRTIAIQERRNINNILQDALHLYQEILSTRNCA